jgi:hypothetical protein
MASPDPTSMGSATWTGGGRQPSFGIISSTNATPIVITSAAAHGLVTGDYVIINGHVNNTNANGIWKVGTTPTATTFQILQMDGSNTTGNGVGNSGTRQKANNLIVKTASALVGNIALCGGLGQKPAWTASTNITAIATTSTTNKEGAHAAEFAVGAAFTTGKAAYYTLPSTLDLSAYQQVTFWIRQTVGTIGSAGQVYVGLCTDTTGGTVVHQCDVPALTGPLSSWFPVTVNLGVNLNAAIRSVAFYVATDLGAQTFQLDNIVACKAASSADSVTLQSLISKSDGTGDEAWYAIQSINNDVIMLANANSSTGISNNVRGYSGATETVTSYKRETTKTVPSPTTSTAVATISDNGGSGSPITFSGGWNRTDMSTQTGRTWYDGSNGNGFGLVVSSRSFVSIDRLDFCRYNVGLQLSGSTNNTTIGSAYATASSTIGIEIASGTRAITCTQLWGNNNNSDGVLFAGTGSIITDVKLASNNVNSGLYIQSAQYNNVGSVVGGNNGTNVTVGDLHFTSCFNCAVGTATLTDNLFATAIVSSGSVFDCSVNGGSSTGHAQGVRISTPTQLYLNNFTINETTEVSSGGIIGIIYANRLDNTDNNSWVFHVGIGTVNQQTAVVDSPATTAWRMLPTSTNVAANSPLPLKLGTVVCAANSLVTVTARMQRSNTGLTMRLVCPGGQITGVDTNVSSDMTAAINTWETVTITFTPTKAGGVDIYAHAFGGTTFSGYVCNLTASQA